MQTFKWNWYQLSTIDPTIVAVTKLLKERPSFPPIEPITATIVTLFVALLPPSQVAAKWSWKRLLQAMQTSPGHNLHRLRQYWPSWAPSIASVRSLEALPAHPKQSQNRSCRASIAGLLLTFYPTSERNCFLNFSDCSVYSLGILPFSHTSYTSN